MSESFDVITSIRSDQILLSSEHNGAYSLPDENNQCLFYLLRLHRDRLIEACEAFGRSYEYLNGFGGLRNFKQQLEHCLLKHGDSDGCVGPLKLRVAFTEQGHLRVNASSVPAVPIEVLFPKNLNDVLACTGVTYSVFISPRPIFPSLFTRHKTTNRSHYDQQRALLSPTSCVDKQEVVLLEMLVINLEGKVMEGTITTPYFYRDGEWITPAVSCGGHLGVARRWALTAGLCKEGMIVAEEIAIGERVILSNGVRGFGWGVVKELKTGDQA